MEDTPRTTTPEVPAAPRWIAARVAHPVRELDRSVSFYRDLLDLPPRGGFTDHDGYSGMFFALPGGGELELTAGPSDPLPGTEDDLLVLYVAGPDEADRRAAALESVGVPTVRSANPYWDRRGRTFLDPDGHAVVVAAWDGEAASAGQATAAEVRVERYVGERERLRALFELAEDSSAELDSYLHAGRVLVAVTGTDIVGHLQVVDDRSPGRAEVTNMAVRDDLRGRGIGSRLVAAAAELAAADGATELLVATAAADTGNLRFYQRQGFRLRAVQRDAFTPAAGYPPGLRLDGIELRDRVWLDRPLTPPGNGRPGRGDGVEPTVLPAV
jgi:ribosomal protein S18 acetylase RimI-like enzyme